MYQLILFFHVLIAALLVGLVLIQQGKGAAAGAAFGSGASQTMFGSRGSGSFLFRITMGFLALFFVTSIVLNNLATRAVKQPRQIIQLPVTPERQAPAPVSNNKTEQTSAPAAPGDSIPARQ